MTKKLALAALFTFGLFVQSKAQLFKNKRHSITPMVGYANNGITQFTIYPTATLKIDYFNGDEYRMPVTLRYQYKMNHGHKLGIDLLGNYNPISLHPASKDPILGFTGPVISPQLGSMYGADIHYSKTIDIKVIQAFGFVGLGAYYQPTDYSQTKDYSWYRHAPAEFYDFAVASTNNSVREILPITNFGVGARVKHIEIGYNYQISLNSPINSFEYNGVKFNNNLRFRSKGFYVGYRYEF